ncbi:MAG: valine--tRNA ligase, partial [Clostridia bacterium]|nr:valine--tRNA ligase [Clostridia bacterium]
HNLPIINVMTDDAKITEDYPKYAGMDRYEARKAIVNDLEEEGALVKIEDYSHNVGTCYRCSTTVEPRVSKQWFVKMKPLAGPAIDAVKNDDTQFIPPHFEKTYFHWLENIRDWCISRQLWWGHQIPAFYCDDCGETVVTKENEANCPKCGKPMRQDPDTLDTWFSSALWPFSTLGWPDHTPELDYFYPTSVLVTGYDIIPFWVMRMMFSGLEHVGKVPFGKVLIHGLVRDAQGRKMSKSLGNGIDPLEVIDQFGADALRLTLVTGNAPGNDMRYSEEKITASRNFANKLWNAARFIHMNIDDYDVKNELPDKLAAEDKWIVSTLNTVIQEVTENLEKYELGVAVQKLYDFIWDCLCDWYIELTKSRLQSEGNSAQNARQVLVWVMTQSLKLLHPFMPFITEEIWQSMPHSGETIMLEEYPVYTEEHSFPEAEKQMNMIMDAIKAIRNRRSEMNVPPSRKAKVFIAAKDTVTFQNGRLFFSRLASASEVNVAESYDIDGAVTIVTADAKIYIPMDELVDKDAELKRLNKELETAQKDLMFNEKKLNNQGFMAKAPEKVVAEVKANAAKFAEKIEMIKAAIDALK